MTISNVELALIKMYIEEKHPELKLATIDKQLAVMLEEKAITQAQYNKMMAVSLFVPCEEDTSCDLFNIMGLEKSVIKRINHEHEETSLLKVEDDGTLVQNQFDLEEIKKKFNEEDYTVDEILHKEHYKDYDFECDIEYKIISVINKETGKKELEYTIDDDHITIDELDDNGEVKERVLMNGGKNTFNKDEIEPWYVSAIYKNDAEGQFRIDYEYHSLKVKEKRRYVKIGGYSDIETRTVYTNNKPYQTKTDGKTVKNSIVDDIRKTLHNKNFLGGIKDINKLEQIIYGITPKNIYEVLNDYKSVTGNDLLDDIEKASKENDVISRITFSNNIPSKGLIHHLRECMQPGVLLLRDELYFSQNSEINYITDRLVEDYNGERTPETFLKDLELISSDGTEIFDRRCTFSGTVMENFRKKTGKSLFNVVHENNNLDDKQKYDTIIKILYGFGRYKIEEYKQELDNLANNEEIMNLLFKSSGTYYEDIKADMALHKNDTERWLVDLQRLYSRGQCKEKDVDVSSPNGKIDVDFKQGNTGDCWLLAGLISICKKNTGKSAVENLLTIDNKNKTVEVRFKGVNKTYKISFDEINSSDYLSGGDGDIRAIELAFDKYIRELAYSEGGDIDICGNTTEYLYSVLFGNAEHIDGYSKDKKFNFNSESDYYCFGVSPFNIEDFSILKDALIKENGETDRLYTRHAYAIIKSDEDYLYLINPWDSAETLRITHENLEKLKPGIGHYKLK